MALWQQVYNWAIAHGYSFDYAGSGKAANHPVQTIDWYDCVKWCNARSEMEGRMPAYYTSAAQTVVYRTGQVDVDNSSGEVECGLPVANGSGVGEGGAGRSQRAAVSVGQHDFSGVRRTTTLIPGRQCALLAYDVNPTSGYNPAFNDGVYPYTSPVGYFCAERVWALRHGGECIAVVLGLVWQLRQRLAKRSAWANVRLRPGASGRRLRQLRDLLPVGDSRLRRPGRQQRLHWIPFRPTPRSVS